MQPAVTTVRTQEYRKTYLSSGQKIKLLFSTPLLINPEHPGRVSGPFTPIQNLGSILQKKQETVCQYKLTFTYPTLQHGLLSSISISEGTDRTN